MDLYGFTLISIVFHGFERSGARVFGGLWQPVPPCATLCHPVPPVAAGLDPLHIKISDSGGLDLEAWCLNVWMLAGLEWIGGGDGGIGGDGRRGLEEVLTRTW